MLALRGLADKFLGVDPGSVTKKGGNIENSHFMNLDKKEIFGKHLFFLTCFCRFLHPNYLFQLVF